MRKHVRVTGHVQGVFFRDSTRAQAQQRGVGGWVRNRDDGSVEAELEGPEDAVDAVVAWMRDGPEHARVERVVVGDLPTYGETEFAER